jgi:hypothetical protein
MPLPGMGTLADVRARFRTAAAIFCLGFVLGCGDAPPEIARPDKPVLCPRGDFARVPLNELPPGKLRELARAAREDPLDARALLGRTVEEARAISARHRCVVAVCEEGVTYTSEGRLNRVNVRVEDGVVMSVEVG